jgi:hypothetical protein
MDGMKAETAPRLGAVDALAAGLNLAVRRPWLLVTPVLIDLGLWLMPRLSVQTLLRQAQAVWEALVLAFYTEAQQTALAETIQTLREAFASLGQQIDLMTALTTGWLAAPSALVDVQATRFKLISDGVLAPLGLGVTLPPVAAPPWQLSEFDISNVWLAGLVLVALWLLGQALTTFYLRSVAVALVAENTVPVHRDPERMPNWNAQATESTAQQMQPTGGRIPFSLGALFLRFMVLSLLLGVIVFLIRVPLALAMALAAFSGSTLAAGIFVFSGGLTLWFMLWFLSAVFFASEAMLFDGQSMGPALWQALVLARTSGWRTFGLITLVNLIALGFRAVWGLMGQTPLGVLISILGNAYLATGLLLAIFIYYNGLRRELQALRTARKVIK